MKIIAALLIGFFLPVQHSASAQSVKRKKRAGSGSAATTMATNGYRPVKPSWLRAINRTPGDVCAAERSLRAAIPPSQIVD